MMRDLFSGADLYTPSSPLCLLVWRPLCEPTFVLFYYFIFGFQERRPLTSSLHVSGKLLLDFISGDAYSWSGSNTSSA